MKHVEKDSVFDNVVRDIVSTSCLIYRNGEMVPLDLQVKLVYLGMCPAGQQSGCVALVEA
jgi:hypothetical protein